MHKKSLNILQKTAYIFVISLLSWIPVVAQVQLSTPLEILTFMEASPTEYELEQLYGDAPRKNRPVLAHGTYIQTIDKKEYLLEYKDTETNQQRAWKEKAAELIRYENPNYKKARSFYQKILKQSPQNAQIHTLIGQCYYEEENYEEALVYFRKALKINPIDYLARWLIAEIHLKKKEIDLAVYNITLAHLYNRNHPRLHRRLHEVFQEEGRSYFRDWEFDPKYYLYKEDDRVVITADGIWLTYGMYKAVWKYEPDYLFIKSQQEVTDYLFQEEMEAVIGTFMTYNTLKSDDNRNYPSMNALALCLDHNMVEEFVMYEILLVDKPLIAKHLTEDFVHRIIQYIDTIRGVKLTKK